jgi:serine O-acetyltransferase
MTQESLASLIHSDLSRIVEREATFVDFLKVFFMPRGANFHYVLWYRIVSHLKHKKHRILAILPYFILRHYEYKYGMHLNPNITVGKGLLIVHGGAVYLNCESIGENFTVYQGVTLGSKKYGSLWEFDVPSIGDNVTIYTGATVCGKIHVGDNVIIGAHAYVDKNVEDNAKVIGPASRTISN